MTCRPVFILAIGLYFVIKEAVKGGTEEYKIKDNNPRPNPRSEDKITPPELRAAFQALIERLDTIEVDITALRDGLATAASHCSPSGKPQAAPAPAQAIAKHPVR